jgi:hypothetical protein
MTDAQRFLRYVTPGITFSVATLLLLWILIPDWTSPELGAFFKKDTALAAILATFFASGGLGYLLSVVHYCLHWVSRSSGVRLVGRPLPILPRLLMLCAGSLFMPWCHFSIFVRPGNYIVAHKYSE